MIIVYLVGIQTKICFYRKCQERFPSAFRHGDYRAA